MRPIVALTVENMCNQLRQISATKRIFPLIRFWEEFQLRSNITKEDIAYYRSLLLARAKELDHDGRSAVALSGGVDSATALFALLEIGSKPKCYTFYVKGYKSPDLASARKLAKHFGVDLVEVEIPSDVDSIYRDIVHGFDYAQYLKKTIVQTMIPWKYLCPLVEGPRIVTGLGQDLFYGLGRDAAVMLHKEGELAVFKYRKVDMTHSVKNSDGNCMLYAREAFHKELCAFYETAAISDFFIRFTLASLQKPYEKWVTVEAFKDYFNQGPFYRKHLNYQMSGIKQSHDSLLKSKYNTRGSKAIIALYRDISKSIPLKIHLQKYTEAQMLQYWADGRT